MLIFWLHKNNVIVSEYVLNIRMVRLMDINYSGGGKIRYNMLYEDSGILLLLIEYLSVTHFLF